VAGALRYLRASYTISGATPSFTFSVAGTALVVYATPDDFDALAPSAAASEDFSVEDKSKALESATSEADGYLNARYTLPLTAWGHDLRQCVVSIAAYRLLVRRGWSPVAPEDDTVRTGYTDALAWLAKVKDERISPPDIVDSTPEVYDAGAFVVSKPKRGW
jgi:phage gp36-like protein